MFDLLSLPICPIGCLISVIDYEWGLNEIDSELITTELCYHVITQNGFIFATTPNKYIDSNLCLHAIKSEPYTLKYIPTVLLTAEMCLLSVTNASHTISYVPQNMITERMSLAAVKNNGFVMYLIPKKFQSKELHEEAKRTKLLYNSGCKLDGSNDYN